MRTRDWGNLEKAKVLVIGHDPRLQKAQTIATYCFFADYYFQPKPSRPSDLRKYQLAESLFKCIRELTSGRYCDDEILITNLCNDALPQTPKRKTVFIPRDKAEEGLAHIRACLKASNVSLIFAMSQQVNYWLQTLGFYAPVPEFLKNAEPKEIGIASEPPYYQPKNPGAFKTICGKKYLADGRYVLFPILHIKSYPLKGRFLAAYGDRYETCKGEVGSIASK